MGKRKSTASSASPRKKAKLDLPAETPSLQTFKTNASSSSSSSSSPSSSLSSASQRREKRKRSDNTQTDDPDESDTSINTKRAKTQSPANSRRQSSSPHIEPHDDSDESDISINSKLARTRSPPYFRHRSPSPNFDRPLHDNNPEDDQLWGWRDDSDESDASINAERAKTQSPANSRSQSPSSGSDWVPHDEPSEEEAYINWTSSGLTERARRWQEAAHLTMQGYRNCSCGKMHYAIGRKSWHYPGQEPELDDEDEPAPDEPDVRPESVSVYQSRGQTRLLSPELSDEEADAGNNQHNLAPTDVSTLREPSTAPDSPVPVMAEAPAVSPTTSPAITPAANTSRVRRERNNEQQNVGKSKPRHRTHRKNKNQKEKESKDKTLQRQPRNRKPKTTPVAEEPVVSRRSSRRSAGSQLWFLDDSGKACLLAASSR